jgi:hypothetical protein
MGSNLERKSEIDRGFEAVCRLVLLHVRLVQVLHRIDSLNFCQWNRIEQDIFVDPSEGNDLVRIHNPAILPGPVQGWRSAPTPFELIVFWVNIWVPVNSFSNYSVLEQMNKMFESRLIMRCHRFGRFSPTFQVKLQGADSLIWTFQREILSGKADDHPRLLKLRNSLHLLCVEVSLPPFGIGQVTKKTSRKYKTI